MKMEYIIFNAIILSGPLALSFDRRVNFVRHWKSIFIAIVPTAFLFLLWDILVAGKHWFFNEEYTLDARLFGLPPGEWLFFGTVTYAALFTWEVLNTYFPKLFLEESRKRPGLWWLILPGTVYAIYSGRNYTALMLLSLAFSMGIDRWLKTSVLQKRGTLIYSALLTIMILIFNGYLTARPVVLYDSAYQLDWRIFTIPIEDFGYGYSLILLVTAIYEKFRRRTS